MAFYVYILASRRNGTLYVGVTDNLVQRVWMHRNGVLPGFTKQYGVKTLVWYEQHETREAALTRERQMKKWNRHGSLRSSKKPIQHGPISMTISAFERTHALFRRVAFS